MQAAERTRSRVLEAGKFLFQSAWAPEMFQTRLEQTLIETLTDQPRRSG